LADASGTFAQAPSIQRVTVHADIKNEDKEKPCSFKFILTKDGKVTYERAGWGLEEGWEDNTNCESSSGDLSKSQTSTKGLYGLDMEIDHGKRCDNDSEWYVEIWGTDGYKWEGAHWRHFWRNNQTHASFSFGIND
jgi:hypothetical protein